ncbi:Beta-lactamase [Roseovarius sp. EC-HK134]|uniref:class A beta-lactamase n=1 Tax=unclassified Roseovarius TaxID=2614913 RepID=UPI0012589649|nr:MULTISPECIES: class A beta-lactamase [unclassified Roseovarius]VVT21361.1 Beta-lactamase [Roseovarius sp. EC-SD190]VVT21473.1 Beta-lactamase [Roseovarius sp. EC-HK134]
MLTHAATLPLLAAGVSLALLTGAPAFGQNPKLHLAATIDRIEQELDARVGVVIRESGSDWIVSHRAEERFLMASTFKTMLCGAVLHRVDEGDLDLEERIAIEAAEVLEYAPVTEKMVGETMSVGELCHAALDMSDNAATNLLIDRIEGPQSVTAFLREIGDPVSRLDRREPDVNTFAPDDPRDTTTPEAMVSTMVTLLTGDALSPQSRAQLVDWMSDGGVTGALIRASTPAGWHVADRSGSGNFNRNIVAMVTPPDREPYFIAIFLSDADADFNTRNGAVIELSKAVMQVVTSR